MRQKQTAKDHMTIQDVARAAGTSPSSVSRVLTGNANVSDEKRQAILDVIAQTSYRPNLLARSLKTRSTQFIGLIINDILNPFYGAIVRGAEDRASESGYALILSNTNEQAELELADIRLLKDKSIDGIIVAPSGANSDILQQCMDDGIAVVQIDRRYEDLNSPAVVLDNYDAAYTATRHLVDQGFERLGFIGYALGQMSMLDRERGFRAALNDAGLNIRPDDVVLVDFTVESIQTQISTRFAGTDRPQAVLAGNNRITIALLSALQELNLIIPQDMAVVAFDDLSIFSLLTPPLTAVAQPAYAMGQIAVDLLLGQLSGSGKPPYEPVVFPAELVVRGSSKKI
jgi:DNA-binding LacI/PurR family transcriptional regulator